MLDPSMESALEVTTLLARPELGLSPYYRASPCFISTVDTYARRYKWCYGIARRDEFHFFRWIITPGGRKRLSLGYELTGLSPADRGRHLIHLDQDPSNCTRENLGVMIKGRPRPYLWDCPYRGVSWCRNLTKWRSELVLPALSYYRLWGYYDTAEAAARAYVERVTALANSSPELLDHLPY